MLVCVCVCVCACVIYCAWSMCRDYSLLFFIVNFTNNQLLVVTYNYIIHCRCVHGTAVNNNNTTLCFTLNARRSAIQEKFSKSLKSTALLLACSCSELALASVIICAKEQHEQVMVSARLCWTMITLQER